MLAPTLEPEVMAGTAREASVIADGDFATLILALRTRGYTIVGPTIRQDTIVYAEIERDEDLPIGWTEQQAPGEYRLQTRDDRARFGYAVGPTNWKRFLYPPVQCLWRAEQVDGGFEFVTEPRAAPKYAFVGVRACDLHALAILDKLYLDGPGMDPDYAARRRNALIIAVQCTTPAATCFCASLNTGPVATEGYDLALTELPGATPTYVVDVGSVRGAEILADVPHRPATPADTTAAQAALAATGFVRAVKTDGLHDRLMHRLDHPYWDEVAARCLTCGNCTQVCPTCFCMSIEDSTDLTGQTAARTRRPDSCFTTAFSYVSGGSIRTSPRARYRQWLTHKFAGWIDQFGVLGCVGCGRCITWCPAAIDITAEVAHLADLEGGEDHAA